MQTTKTYTNSILSPELEITETKWALSYCMKGHVTGQEPDHIFLIIQTDEELYKREVCYDQERADLGESGFAIVRSKETAYTSRTLDKYFNKIVWEDEKNKLHVDESLAITSNVRHKTWLVDSAKIQSLLEDIDKDAATPPKFFLLGNTSVLERNEFSNRVRNLAIGVGLLALVHTVHTIDGQEIPTGPLLLAMATCYSFDAANTLLGGKTRHGKHSCATWAKEKLNALEISEIDRDLENIWTDRIAYIPSFHMEGTPEDAPGTREFLEGRAKGQLKKMCGIKTEAPQVLAGNAKETPDSKGGLTISGYRIY
jgi:hypothetical protein